MIREVEIVVRPEEAFDHSILFRQFLLQHYIRENEVKYFSVFKRSLDARSK